jgi:hypothetical protein
MNYYNLGAVVTVLVLVVYGLRLFFRGARDEETPTRDALMNLLGVAETKEEQREAMRKMVARAQREVDALNGVRRSS